MQALDKALAQVGSVLLGKPEQLKLALACMLAGGHLLIEDLPGMGKTTLAHALARVFRLDYRRVQFTSDMLLREAAYGRNSFTPVSPIEQVPPGAFYLESVDETWRRSYARRA